MRKWARSWGTALAVMGASLAAGESQAETLVEALTAAYGANNTLAAGRAKLRAADEGVSQAAATWRPSVTINGTAGRQILTSPANPPFYKYNNYLSNQSISYGLVQPLYQGGLSPALKEQADSTVLAERATLRGTEATVLLNAATAFLDVLRDREILRINIENVQNLREQAVASHERFREGEISSTSVAQSEARLSQALAQRTLAEAALVESHANFLAAVGHFPEGLELSPDLVSPPPSVQAVKEAALVGNPALVSARHAYEAAKSGIDVAFAPLLPQVSLTVQRTKNWNVSYAGSYLDQDQVFLSVSVPLYQSGAEYSKVRAQKETTAQRRLESDQARVDTLQAAEKAWNELERARRTEAFYQEQVTFNVEAVAGVQEEEQIGSRTVIEVLNAKQELVTARVSLVQAHHDLRLAAFQLRAVTGTLTAEALGLPVARFDPAAHYEQVKGQWFGTGDASGP